MSASLAGRVLGRSVAVGSVARCSRPQYLRFRAQGQSFKPTTRAFSASMRGMEKRYTEDHEWIELSSDGQSGTIGISTYAAKALGDVVYVELPQLDLEVNAGDSIGAVESVKSASDIMTPISGTITEINSVLEDKPAVINSSPEGDGWLAKVAVGEKGRGEVGKLMDGGAYNKFTEEAEGK